MPTEFVLWGAVIVVAILVDLWTSRWLRQRQLAGDPPLWRQLRASLAARAERPPAAKSAAAPSPANAAPKAAAAAAPAMPEPAQTPLLPEDGPAAPVEAAPTAAEHQPQEQPKAAPAQSSEVAEEEAPAPTPHPARVESAPAASYAASAAPAPEAAAGVSRVHVSFELAPGARVRVTVESMDDSSEPVTIISDPGQATATIPAASHRQASPQLAAPRARAVSLPRIAAPALGGLWAPLRPAWEQAAGVVKTQTAHLDQVLFWLGLAVYVVTRFVGLERYPIYFFSDEAIQTVLAANFVRDGFANYLGEVLPTYFQNGPFWNLSVSVYLQVAPYLIFGKSIVVARGASALVTVLAAVSIGLMLRRIYKVPYWWVGVLLLSVSPAWFLHSRTAFETAEMTAFYAAFLYAYLLYRYHSPRYLYATLALGALAFYAYSPGQMVMLVTGLLLLISDFRYHYANRAMALNSLTLAAVLALPFLRFRLTHPEAMADQLRERGSFLVDPNLSLATKLSHTWSEYVYGLSVGYWFVPNGRDLGRHVMDGYGNLPLFMLPLAALGLALALRKWRSPAYRTLLIALVASPTGGALAEIGVTRVLMYVIPAVALAALGLSAILEWLEKRRAPRGLLAAGVFALLAGFNIYMLRDALTNGPTWVRDYGLGGMQYGAKQLFQEAIPDVLRSDPQATISVTSSWANSPDLFPQFFLAPEDQSRVFMFSLDYFLLDQRDLPPDLVLIMTDEEYQRAIVSPKLKDVEVSQVLLYPDGTPGFYFTRFAYADNAAEAFEAEREARRQLITEQIEWNGERVSVAYSALGGGSLNDMLDGDRFTLARGFEANPYVIEITYPSPRVITDLSADFGSMQDFTVTASLYATEDATPALVSQTYRDLPIDPHIDLALDGAPPTVIKVRLEVRNNDAGEVANIHIREVAFR